MNPTIESVLKYHQSRKHPKTLSAAAIFPCSQNFRLKLFRDKKYNKNKKTHNKRNIEGVFNNFYIPKLASVNLPITQLSYSKNDKALLAELLSARSEETIKTM